MKKILGLYLFAFSAFVHANGIDGYWQTIDDKTGNPKGIMQIYTQENVTYGKVLGGYPVNGVVPHQICTKCPSPFTNQPVTSMQIMWGFTYNPQDQDYENGHILDPDSGHIYHAMLIPTNNGQNLKVHGYIGIPLIGRTQIWNRLTEDQFNAVMKEYPQN